MGQKMFKGFDKNMKCRGFQYAIGETYHEEKADLCAAGFHACENPLDVFNYYHPRCGAHICEVELDDICAKTDNDDTKRCGKTIKIGAELNIAGLCKAHFEYVTARCNPAASNAAGDNESASAGHSGSASAGECGSASAGECGSASAGNSGSASAGECGSASAGDRGSASAGNRGSASAGEWGSASAGNSGSASAGECGSASAGEWGSASAGNSGSASAGKNGIACALCGKVKGELGCAICTTEQDDEGNNIAVKAAIVDGVNIKENTWYKVENGEWVEVIENA
jgi:hypothetical protein